AIVQDSGLDGRCPRLGASTRAGRRVWSRTSCLGLRRDGSTLRHRSAWGRFVAGIQDLRFKAVHPARVLRHDREVQTDQLIYTTALSSFHFFPWLSATAG